MTGSTFNAVLALFLLLSAGIAADAQDDHGNQSPVTDEYCGPHGHAHDDHCDCMSGYVYREGEGCVPADGEGVMYGDEHHEGRPNWPDCECVVSDINCTEASSRADAALEHLLRLNCTNECMESDDCVATFFAFNALHNGCPGGSMSTDAEVAYHRYADICPNCHILPETLTPSQDLPPCPAVSCNETGQDIANDAWGVLTADCNQTCDSDACREAWEFALAFHELCPNELTFEQGELFHLLDPICEHLCEVQLHREVDCSRDVNQHWAHLEPLFDEVDKILAESQ